MTTATFANGTTTSFGPSFVQNPYTNPFINQGPSFGTFSSQNTTSNNCCLIWDCNGCCYVCTPNGQCCPVSACSNPSACCPPFGNINSGFMGGITGGIGTGFVSPFASTFNPGLGVSPWNSTTPWACGTPGISPFNCSPFNCSPYACSPFNCSPYACSPYACFPGMGGQGFGMPSFGVPFGCSMPYNWGPVGYPQGTQNPQGDQQLRNNG